MQLPVWAGHMPRRHCCASHPHLHSPRLSAAAAWYPSGTQPATHLFFDGFHRCNKCSIHVSLARWLAVRTHHPPIPCYLLRSWWWPLVSSLPSSTNQHRADLPLQLIWRPNRNSPEMFPKAANVFGEKACIPAGRRTRWTSREANGRSHLHKLAHLQPQSRASPGR